MGKVGIITFHRPINHGAILQAMSSVLTLGRLGFDAEIIDYRFRRIEYYRESFRPSEYPEVARAGFTKFAKRVAGDLLFIGRNQRQKMAFEEFEARYLKKSSRAFSSIDELRNDAREYSHLIVGSDLVWNAEMADGVNPVCFLDFADRESQTTIAYAPSIGTLDVDQSLMPEYECYLKNFDYLSIRENTGRDILQPLTEKEIKKVLDPSLLTQEGDWDFCTEKYQIDEPYILSFMLEKSETLLETVESIKRKTGYKVITFDLRNYYPFDTDSEYCSGPARFLALIRRASFVVTNSFHGCAFSLIFHRNFWCIPHSTRGTRMTDLLAILGLQNRVVKESVPDDLLASIGYERVDELLDKERQRSIEYLLKALNNK